MLLDHGGSILVSHMYEDVLGDKDSLFASAISAISNLFGEAIGESIHYIQTKNYHLYIGFTERLVLIVVSTIENPQVYALLKEALKKIEELGYDVDDITFSMEVQDHVDNTVSNVLRKPVLSLSTLRNFARQIVAFVSIDNHEKYGIRLVEPVTSMDIPETKIKPLIGDISLEELFEALIGGNYDYVVGNAPKKFLESDLAKVLYSKACLLLLDSGLSKKVDTTYLYNVIKSIEDKIIREYLLLEFESFFKLGKFAERYRFIEQYKEELFEKINTGKPIERKILLALLYPVHIKEVLDIMKDEFKNNEEIIASVLELSALANVLSGKPESLDEWGKIYGNLKYKVNQTESLNARLRFHHAMQYVNVWGLLLEDVDVDMGRDLLLKSLNLAEEEFKAISGKKLSNTLKAISYYVTYAIGLCTLLDTMAKEDKQIYAKKYIGKILDIIKWLNNVAKAHEIKIDIYYVTLTGFLALYTKLNFILGSTKTFINLIIKLLRDELESIWTQQDYIYALFYIDILKTLGYMASMIEVAMARKKILLDIARNLERIGEHSAHIPLICAIATLNAIKFYTLANSDRADFLQGQIERFGQFFYDVASILRGRMRASRMQSQKSSIEKIVSFIS